MKPTPLRSSTWCVALVWSLLGSVAALPLQAQDKPFWESAQDQTLPAMDVAWAKGTAAMTRGDLDQLKAITIETAQIAPKDPRNLWLQASVAEAEARHQDALDLLAQIKPETLKEPLTEAMVKLVSGQSLASLERWEEASEVLESVHTRNQSQYNLLGMLYLVQSKHELALRNFREALRVENDHLPSLLGCALTLETQGKHREARTYLLRYILKAPSSDPIHPSWFLRKGDDTLVRALLNEETGEHSLASEKINQFKPIGTQDSILQPLSRRLKETPASLLGQGPLPIGSPTAVLADPKGRFMVLGDKLGKLWTVRLRDQKVEHMLALSGPGIVDLAWRPSGELLVAYEDSFLGRYKMGGRPQALAPLGPMAMRNGTLPLALVPGGELVLGSSGRRVYWSLASADNLGQELFTFQGSSSFRDIALSPAHSSSQRIYAGLLLASGQVRMVQGPGKNKAQVLTLPGAPGPHKHAPISAIAMSSDGRYLVAVSARHLVVVRASDHKVMRILRLTRDDASEQPSQIMFDETGGAGHGPALVVFYGSTYQAYGLDVLVNDE